MATEDPPAASKEAETAGSGEEPPLWTTPQLNIFISGKRDRPSPHPPVGSDPPPFSLSHP